MNDGDYGHVWVFCDTSGFSLKLKPSQFSRWPGYNMASSITLKVFRAFVRTSFDSEANRSNNKSRDYGNL
jgi:hypothetical protein